MTTDGFKTTKVTILPDGRMDTKNAAIYLGLKPKTLAMMRSAGTGPEYVKLGRIFYYRDDLDNWVNEHRLVSTAQLRASGNAA